MLEVLNSLLRMGGENSKEFVTGWFKNTKKNSLKPYFERENRFLSPDGNDNLFCFFGEENQVREKQKRYSGQREIASYLSWRV